ncbi:hypothetical protein L198_02288 [Cryptococcus wingfieldii CBS 7118]|uniref:Uncharacterized protein n=1 Tax=Cryptococcus wingfieldii CBS 7118 TaxID=1295528 RepID=A0A1E3JRD5_9TREE|nr:hypothetical protein L198_02288 [Cryptococcus wingfieldii CBS 7118]ODO03441.1 hypothetical protein L198_02288 [Cryptococcus wingfieldii CBS 7118]
MSTIPSLPVPGEQQFPRRLLHYIAAHPALRSWALSPPLLSILLLVLIVRQGGLVVDVEDDGRDKLVSIVYAMMESIFSMTVRTLSLSAVTRTDELPWSLFRNHTPRHVPSQESQLSDVRPRIGSRKSTNLEVNGHLHHNLDKDHLDLPEVLIVTGLENASGPVQMKMCDYLTKKRVEARVENEDRVWEFEPVVVWVRREGAEVPWWVTDHFMCGTTVDPFAMDKPPRGLRPGAIIPQPYLKTLSLLLPYTHIHASISMHISNLLSAITTHPSLHSAITSRAVRAFPIYVRAHRLLVGDFTLPHLFEVKLHQQDSEGVGSQNKKGLGGGTGGVDSWNIIAGEEPDVNGLRQEGNEEDFDGWHVMPANVQGVWNVLMAHRVKKRREREEVMWLVKGPAHGGRRSAPGGSIDDILNEIIRTI